ncbi:MAG TPA: bifunctional histidinol-phosphatase/imidazoleglycerol-phosphate dehydratase HisB [Arenimonas sp.]|nr:bifunctional histidinol-phosphatase/imidazoleglycerol-phosphate dehydratase HisB [Arenimonas sp.]HOZ03859.1 bifunctional histidinol-phosphatase/imidazoleglycerol-phosphate dehydratase HisB [Arenimonas sp.]HPW32827.1 bifunctional histidinol-phosphatase/imidazoleglycerol-phosphate dehydratase HisB [Arenimonas sp.]
MAKILFIDRDGVLIEEPADEQIDSYEKFRLVEGVIPALIKCRDAGFEFVMVSNQDGLGTSSFPTEQFEGPQQLLLQILASQGIQFREILIDHTRPEDNSPNRKPGIGMVMQYLRDRSIDLQASAMVGDRETDMQFAQNLGVKGFRLGPSGYSWAEIAHVLVDAPRMANIERITKETKIRVNWNLDRAANPVIVTGLGFFDHMLEQLGKHSGTALELSCAGDLHIDEHHTVEDSALALGQALKQALGDKRGIARYAFSLPMDETDASALLDLSGRPYFVFEGKFPREMVGDLATELVPHFFRSLCETAGMNLHLKVRGDNAHHMVEACFKVFARALGEAIKRSGNDLPSTKGVL